MKQKNNYRKTIKQFFYSFRVLKFEYFKILMATRDLVEETKSKLKSTTEEYLLLLDIRNEKEEEVTLKVKLQGV